MSVHSIKALRAEFKAVGKFHTPPQLALRLRALLPDPNPEAVYDPTCGAGNLLAVFPDTTRKYGQDIDQAALADAQLLPGFVGAHGDVLTNPAFPDMRFDAIVANPPFSIPWEPDPSRFPHAPTIPTKGRADFAFLLHILNMLTPTGSAVVLQFPGIGYRGGREQQLRQWITDNGWLHRVEEVPGDTFEDTKITTLILTLSKQPTTQVEFVTSEAGAMVSLEEIADNDYSWTPYTYAHPPQPERPPVDRVALEVAARRKTMRDLDHQFAFSHAVCQIDPTVPAFTSFVDAVRRVVDKWQQMGAHP